MCKNCNKDFVPKDKRFATFCSKSCSAAFNNSAKPKRSKSYKDCSICGDHLQHRNTATHRSCLIEKDHTDWIERWLSGLESGITGGQGISMHIKRYLRDTRGNACEECGWCKINPTTKKVPIQIDHIDGNFRNNNPSNLKLLCPSCHSLTPTYGALNKGKSTRNRYK